MARITFFQRKRRSGANFSLEQVFNDLAHRLENRHTIHQKILPFISSGLFKRVMNVLLAPFYQGEVNHVTGDINYVALLLSRRKTVSTFLDLGILHRTKGIKRKILLNIWFKWPVKRSRWVTVISEATRQDLLQNTNCKPEKVKVIYVPISELFQRVDKTFNKECPTILQIGAAPNKNLKGLIEAVKDIPCQLLIIGNISEANLKSLKDSKVKYSNKVAIPFEEVIRAYEESDILFFASTFEGFGMPIIEAQSVGRPVITSNILSMPEVGGDACLYVDPYNIEEIKAGILKIIQEDALREDLIMKGLENAERFDGAKIASQYEVLYNDILKSE